MRLALPLSILAAGLSALVLPGLVHPDEVFQALEPANRLAFGYGVKSWEWEVGLRNWAIPGLLAGILKLVASVGVDDPFWRRAALLVPSLALHGAALRAVRRFAARRVGELHADAAVLLVGLSPLTLLFAGRTLSESSSAALLLLAFERLDVTDDNPKRAGVLAGVLLGLAQVARYGTAPFIVVVLSWLAWKRSRALPFVVAGGGLVALALGLLDALTWGAPWHSLIEYTNFNLIQGKAAGFGRSPWWAYLPQAGVLVCLVALVKWRAAPSLRAPLPTIAALVYIVTISAVPHKEERFFYPAAVLLVMAAAPAFAAITQRTWLTAAAVLLVSFIAALFVPEGAKPKGSDLIALTMRARREGTGLLIVHSGLWGSGGSFAAGGSNLTRLADDSSPTPRHRWCTADDAADPCFREAAAAPDINRAIVIDPLDETTSAAMSAAGFRTVERRGEATWFER